MINNIDRFNALIEDALNQEFSGWDFAYLDGRRTRAGLPWDYAKHVREHIAHANSMLDMGTGGGEFLASLAPLPAKTWATEGWALNVPIAQQRLAPYGVKVHQIDMQDKYTLPFDDNSFDLIINRHEAFDATDIHRMLHSGGYFITQQVGGQNGMRLNKLLEAPLPEFHDISLERAVQKLEEAGLDIIQIEEAFPEERYLDIGAVIFHLKVIKWQIEDFSVEKYHRQLGKIHNMIEQDGYLAIPAHRFFIKARK